MTNIFILGYSSHIENSAPNGAKKYVKIKGFAETYSARSIPQTRMPGSLTLSVKRPS